mmetsp:Transcript_114362/g.180017  ORF Transcript_114362/g.180017 Transcript_114362/m.180017 type:complete len:280 (-) Transcript_114362:57-896(-)|eukprot:CAMPEP_0169308920 /NCGR_PEP_ID=MMETSP1017-20121227/2127_1 /TAXON_ID=342587 /ORGANISM="Karlodinium micrum, Strain CCMP2283" /LENGTH=279 /DNA_ID=CAMNT_0009402395 /DNA_START=34 /DNA_END=873 /DNA_ORIENTATION=+
MPSARDIVVGGTSLVPRNEQSWWQFAPTSRLIDSDALREPEDRGQRRPRAEVVQRQTVSEKVPLTKQAYEYEATEACLRKAGPEFHVSVDRSLGRSLGIEVEHFTDHLLIVMSIGDGLVHDWNLANPDLMMEEQDYICAVNDVSGDVELILDECRLSKPLTLTVRRPLNKPVAPTIRDIEFKISLDRSTGMKLGIDVNHENGPHLYIESIDVGLVSMWNDRHPEREVLPDDRIVEVNSKRGTVDVLLEECMKNIMLEMTILRTVLTEDATPLNDVDQAQ